MAKQVGTMEFWYRDHTEDKFNESVDCSFEVWGNELDGMTMEQYYGFCRKFAATLGFGEKTINDWFDLGGCV